MTTIYHDMLSAMGLPTTGGLPDALAAAWWNPSDTTLRELARLAYLAGVKDGYLAGAKDGRRGEEHERATARRAIYRRGCRCDYCSEVATQDLVKKGT